MPFVAALLAYIAFALLMPFLLTHPKLRAGHLARFGYYRRPVPKKDGRRIWVHGASAGDVLALLPTVRALKAQHADLEVVASTITNSGYAMATRHMPLFCAVVYAPFDLYGAVRRAMVALQPDLLVLEYTELWPNLIHAARANKVPVVLHNGRVSPERAWHYRLLFALTGNLLRSLRLLLMRDAHEAERAIALGAYGSTVHVTGNTKFDSLQNDPSATKVAELQAMMHPPNGQGPIWVAGSTHEGEEELLLDVFAQLRLEFAELTLILAPRYCERSDKLLAMCQRRGLLVRLRSSLRSSVQPCADVFILDTIGELTACYALATLVFVGGSFVSRGGQNILEPAACGKPVLFGPNMSNFRDSVQVLLGRGGVQVASKEQLLRVMHDLLHRPSHCEELGSTARTQVRAVRGAAQRNAHFIGQLLPGL